MPKGTFDSKECVGEYRTDCAVPDYTPIVDQFNQTKCANKPMQLFSKMAKMAVRQSDRTNNQLSWTLAMDREVEYGHVKWQL